MKKKEYKITTCYKCSSKMQTAVELIIHNGKTAPVEIEKCTKCGESYTSLDNYEKARKILYPTFFERIKNFFSNTFFKVEIEKGKIL